MFKKAITGSLIALAFWLNGKKLAGFNIEIVKSDIGRLSGGRTARDVHVWRKEDQEIALAAHIVIEDIGNRETVQASLKAMLANRYNISHSILEFESLDYRENCS